jgi:hypothetical protein
MTPLNELAAVLGEQLSIDFDHALQDVEQQQRVDRAPWGGQQPAREPSIEYTKTRMRAVLVAAAERDEPYALRQSLIDLAAVAVEFATTLPRPHVELRHPA